MFGEWWFEMASFWITHGGLFPLMCLPARLFCAEVGLGRGRQFVPWIHVADHVRAVIVTAEDDGAAGPYNLVAPEPTTNAEFMRAVCDALHRPFWFHVPACADPGWPWARWPTWSCEGRRQRAQQRLLDAGFSSISRNPLGDEGSSADRELLHEVRRAD